MKWKQAKKWKEFYPHPTPFGLPSPRTSFLQRDSDWQQASIYGLLLPGQTFPSLPCIKGSHVTEFLPMKREWKWAPLRPGPRTPHPQPPLCCLIHWLDGDNLGQRRDGGAMGGRSWALNDYSPRSRVWGFSTAMNVA